MDFLALIYYLCLVFFLCPLSLLLLQLLSHCLPLWTWSIAIATTCYTRFPTRTYHYLWIVSNVQSFSLSRPFYASINNAQLLPVSYLNYKFNTNSKKYKYITILIDVDNREQPRPSRETWDRMFRNPLTCSNSLPKRAWRYVQRSS